MLFHPYARHCDAFGEIIESVHSSHDLLVVCVNTTRWCHHKNGEVSTEQIERVARRLGVADPEQLRVVVVHQSVVVLRAEDVTNLLRGHTAALRRWAAAGADLVMGRHIHLPYVMALPDLARPMWAVQAGTGVSSRVRDGVPNSVNLLRLTQDFLRSRPFGRVSTRCRSSSCLRCYWRQPVPAGAPCGGPTCRASRWPFPLRFLWACAS